MKATLPWPPGVNNLYAVVHGRKIKSSAGREYGERVFAALGEKQIKFGEKRVSISLVMHQPTKQRTDLDGRLKALFDALTMCRVWGDDSQVDELHVVRGVIVKGGSVEIEIRELGQLSSATAVTHSAVVCRKCGRPLLRDVRPNYVRCEACKIKRKVSELEWRASPWGE